MKAHNLGDPYKQILKCTILGQNLLSKSNSKCRYCEARFSSIDTDCGNIRNWKSERGILIYFDDDPMVVTFLLVVTPAKSHSISVLKARIFDSKMMVKSGIRFFFEIQQALRSCYCPVQTKKAELAWKEVSLKGLA